MPDLQIYLTNRQYLVEKELERPRAELEARIQCLEKVLRDVINNTQTESVDEKHAKMILETIAAKARAVVENN